MGVQFRRSAFDQRRWRYRLPSLARGSLTFLCALLDKLRQDAYGDLRNALGLDGESYRTGYLGQLLLSSDFFFQELAEDQARLPPAPDHAKKPEGPLNPFAQNQRVMLMAPRDNQSI